MLRFLRHKYIPSLHIESAFNDVKVCCRKFVVKTKHTCLHFGFLYTSALSSHYGIPIKYHTFFLFFPLFLVSYAEESYGGRYKASTKEERRKHKRLRGERDQIKFNDLRFKRLQVVRFRKARGQDVP